jgi:hypothetical protein
VSFRKRLRIMWAAAFQQWHQKTCGECRRHYWVEGPDSQLIALCDECEVRLLEDMGNALQRDWQRRAFSERG